MASDEHLLLWVLSAQCQFFFGVFFFLAEGSDKVGACFGDTVKAAARSGIADMLPSERAHSCNAARCMMETGIGAGGWLDPATDSALDQAFRAFFAKSTMTHLAGEGGGLRHCTTWHGAPKAYALRARIREGARDPSGSSNARTRDDCEPGWKREGRRTQEGSWQTLSWRREGLLSISNCQQAAGEYTEGWSSETPVGTELIMTLPHLTFRREEICGSSGKAQDIAEMRREDVAKSASRMMSGPAKTTKFPLGDHFAVETQTLVWIGSVESVVLQTLTKIGGARAAVVLRVDASV